MTREQYLVYRTNNLAQPLYEYYKEHAKKDLLLQGDFFMIIQQWPEVIDALKFVYNYYDAHFEVMRVDNLKTGQVIRFI